MDVETFVVKVISDGRITLPSAIRMLYRVRDGDLVKVKFLKKISAGAKKNG